MQEQSLKEQLNAYKALHAVAMQHKEQIQSHHMSNIEEEVKRLQLCVEFSMNLECAGYDWYQKYLTYDCKADVGLYKESNGRQISWSDDGRQPENEWLCLISFPTGAYIFGNIFKNEYPKETFNKFFEELKSYGTKYCDTNNHKLYFTSDVAHKVVKDFPEIFKKYKAMCQEEYDRQCVKELEAELSKLKGN
jgi:hypothetical protein